MDGDLTTMNALGSESQFWKINELHMQRSGLMIIKERPHVNAKSYLIP